MKGINLQTEIDDKKDQVIIRRTYRDGVEVVVIYTKQPPERIGGIDV